MRAFRTSGEPPVQSPLEKATRVLDTTLAFPLFDFPEKDTDEARNTHVFLSGENLRSLALVLATHAGKADIVAMRTPLETDAGFIYNGEISDDPELLYSYCITRIAIGHRLLSDDGAFFLITDPAYAHRYIIDLNELFGADNFLLNIPTHGPDGEKIQCIAYARNRVLAPFTARSTAFRQTATEASFLSLFDNDEAVLVDLGGDWGKWAQALVAENMRDGGRRSSISLAGDHRVEYLVPREAYETDAYRSFLNMLTEYDTALRQQENAMSIRLATPLAPTFRVATPLQDQSSVISGLPEVLKLAHGPMITQRQVHYSNCYATTFRRPSRREGRVEIARLKGAEAIKTIRDMVDELLENCDHVTVHGVDIRETFPDLCAHPRVLVMDMLAQMEDAARITREIAINR